MRKDQCLASSVVLGSSPRTALECFASRSHLAISIAFGDLACFVSLSFAGLVVLARSLNPIPSRTRPLNSYPPMVLWLKPWESRSLPGLPRTKEFLFTCHDRTKRRFSSEKRRFFV